MAYSVQKLQLAKTVGVSLLLLLAACGSDSKYKRQINGGDAYLQVMPLSKLYAPPGIMLPIQNDNYHIPFVRGSGARGTSLDIRPPAQLLTLVSGASTELTSDTATLLLNEGHTGGFSLWPQVVNIIQLKNYIITKRDDVGQTLNTNWVQWNRLDEDEQCRGRYQIFVKPQGYNKQALVVKLLNLEQGGKPLADPLAMQRYSAEMLNVIVAELDQKMQYDLKNENVTR